MKIDEYLALFEGVKRPENHTLEIDLVDLREAAAEIARLRAENDHLRAELRAWTRSPYEPLKSRSERETLK